VAETTVKRLLCCGFRRTGKAMGQMYRCMWRICREVHVFLTFEYHMFYVLYPFVTYLLTLPRTSFFPVGTKLGKPYLWFERLHVGGNPWKTEICSTAYCVSKTQQRRNRAKASTFLICPATGQDIDPKQSEI
jgi:hypothetical protein